MGLQGVSSIGQSSRRMIALALAKDKALASVLAKALILAPLEFNANCQQAHGIRRRHPLAHYRKESHT